MIARPTPGTVPWRILVAVAEYPGDLDPDAVASDLALPRGEVRSLCRRLREAGWLAPGGYRVWPHIMERIAAAGTVAAAVRQGTVRLSYHEARIVEALVEFGPMLRRELAVRLDPYHDHGVDLTGTDRRVLEDLDLGGIVAPPSRLWLSAAGEALLTEVPGA